MVIVLYVVILLAFVLLARLCWRAFNSTAGQMDLTYRDEFRRLRRAGYSAEMAYDAAARHAMRKHLGE